MLKEVSLIINAYKKSNIFKQLKFEDIGFIEKLSIAFILVLLIPYLYFKNIYSTIIILPLEAVIGYFTILRIEAILIKKNKLEKYVPFMKLHRKDWQGLRYCLFIREVESLDLSLEDIEQIKNTLSHSLQYEKENSKVIFEKKTWILIMSIIGLFWNFLDVKSEDFPKLMQELIDEHKFGIFIILSISVISLGAIFISFRYSIKTKRDKLEEILLFLEWYKHKLK